MLQALPLDISGCGRVAGRCWPCKRARPRNGYWAEPKLLVKMGLSREHYVGPISNGSPLHEGSDRTGDNSPEPNPELPAGGWFARLLPAARR